MASVFALALAVRLIAVAVLTSLGLEPNPDEGLFWEMGGDLATGEAQDWDSYRRSTFLKAPAFVFLLGALQLLPRSTLVLARLAVALLGAATAALTAALGASLVSRRAGLVAGALVALWPSQVVFSSIALRDAMIWPLLAGLASLVLRGREASGTSLAWWGGGAGLCVLLLAWLRPVTALMAGAGLLVAAVASSARGRWLRTVGVVGMLVVVVLLAGWGTRSAQGLLEPDEPSPALDTSTQDDVEVAPRPPRRDPSDVLRAQAARAEDVEEHQDACTHIGHTESLLTPQGAVTRFARGAPAVLLGPYPWQEVCSTWGTLAKFEAGVYTILLALAIAALVRRRRPLGQIAFPLAVAGGLILVFALGQENVGTAFRHRGEFFWVVALLAALHVRGGDAPTPVHTSSDR